jgi:HSP20 family molecular chaperone IbpA
MNQFDFLVDIVEKKDKFHLSGELPGCNVAHVDVKVDKDNNLHISAMKSIKHEEDEQSPDGSVKWHAIETLSEQRRKRSTRRAFFVARISRFVDATIIRDRFCR